RRRIPVLLVECLPAGGEYDVALGHGGSCGGWNRNVWAAPAPGQPRHPGFTGPSGRRPARPRPPRCLPAVLLRPLPIGGEGDGEPAIRRVVADRLADLVAQFVPGLQGARRPALRHDEVQLDVAPAALAGDIGPMRQEALTRNEAQRDLVHVLLEPRR